MINICFVLNDLAGGGAERTAINLINHLDRQKFSPTLLLFKRNGPFLRHLQSHVNIVDLGSQRSRYSLLPLARYFRKNQPDLVFSTLLFTNALTVLVALAACPRAVRIVRETNSWTAAGRNKWSWPDRLIGWSYRLADKVVSLSQGVAADCIYRYHLAPEQIQVIYNPIDIAHIEHLASQEAKDCPFAAGRSGYFEIMAIGRMTRQKGFDLLLQALALIKTVNWRLTILGEGEDRNELETLAATLGIQKRVLMPGFQENPFAWLKRADLFVLSSRWEGFGHVIAEAMACGVPILATPCPFGPIEIITDGVDGILCNEISVAGLTAQIEYLALNEEVRKRLAFNAKQSVRRFDVKKIVQEYEEMFLNCLHRKHRKIS